MSSDRYKIDMCKGSLFWKMLAFAFPLLCTYELQSLFNAADMLIIGRFASDLSVAAIGATLNPITLVLKIFIGLATGANAVIAFHIGAKDSVKIHRSVHTVMALAAYGGIVFMVVALLCTKGVLQLMKTPPEILHASCLYMWIYFLGIPFLMIYNFGCAILRSAGDSRRPLYYLLAAGIINVLLNLLFVIVFRMDVAGVALATTLSNGLAAGLLVRTLIRNTDCCHLSLRHLHICWSSLKEVLWIGIPAGVNSSFYNVANMLIQSAINSFGALAVAGFSIAVVLESFTTISSSAFQQCAMTFVAQNYGAKLYPRTARCCVTGMLISVGSSLLLNGFCLLFSTPILRLFTSNPEVIAWGTKRVYVMMTFYAVGALMDLSCGCLRGLGYSMTPAVASFLGAFVFRILWVLRAFPHFGTMEALLACYPISWILIFLFNAVMLYVVLRRIFRREAGLDHLALYP